MDETATSAAPASEPAADAAPHVTVTESVPSVTKTPAPNRTFRVTLNEFCKRASEKGKGNSVAMLAAFHFTEERAGHMSDLETNYAERLAALATKPA
jgi:hypothetical protein